MGLVSAALQYAALPGYSAPCLKGQFIRFSNRFNNIEINLIAGTMRISDTYMAIIYSYTRTIRIILEHIMSSWSSCALASYYSARFKEKLHNYIRLTHAHALLTVIAIVSFLD